MKYLIALTAIALFITPAMAKDKSYGHTKTVSYTVTVHNGGDMRPETGCWAVTGNWVNAATWHCPNRGYGPQANTRSRTFDVKVDVPCNRNEKNS